jgi:uncharacterized repeat protein (TIGR02543 family)
MKKKYVIFILVIAVLLLPSAITLSKYITNKVYDYIMESNKFYFSSDKLTEDNHQYEVNNWSGIGNFTIDFNLNNMKNNLLTSATDIDYTLSTTCSQDVVCSLDNNSGTIHIAEKMDNFVLTVTPKRAFSDNESITVQVEANSTNPYKKKLSATFKIVVGKRGISYEIDDNENQPYLDFVITNALNSYRVMTAFGTHAVGDLISSDDYILLSDADKANCASVIVTLSFDPNKVIVDSTSSLVSESTTTTTSINNINYINSMTFKVDALSSNKLRFYKTDKMQNYTYPFVTSEPVIHFSVDPSFSGNYEGQAFVVNFNANGGSVTPTSKTVAYNHTYGDLPVPTKPGLTFAGWYTSLTGGNKITSTSVFLNNSNTTLFARWLSLYNFDYTGDYQTFTAPETGTYKIEAWGAQGGSAFSDTYNGGYGAYSVGTMTINKDTVLYVYVGGQGTNGTVMQTSNFAGGFNGGGTGKGYTNKYVAGGGGASHVAKSIGVLNNLSGNIGNIYIVAGGGGGAAYQSNVRYGYGGAGGGTTGVDGIKYDTDNKSWKVGKGGSQTQGGTGYSSGSFGLGATYGGNDSPGGGGGYYGGGSGQYYAGAGGGSGYIANGALNNKHMMCYNCTESSSGDSLTHTTTNVSDTPTSDYAKKGNGYVRITYIE